jgi:hypothetical protein
VALFESMLKTLEILEERFRTMFPYILYDAKFDAKAPSDVNKAGTPAANTPGRRQTRARGMQ